MNKKLMAVAVAGVLAAPGLALAQSSVTISGFFKLGVDNYKVSNTGPARAATKNSETRVSDGASRIIFGATEDLGGGLSAIGQVDFRFNPDAATTAGTTTNQLGTGNTYVGLRSKTMGTIRLGRIDTHFTSSISATRRITSDAGALQSSACALMCYTMNAAGTGLVGIGIIGRTMNNIYYDSPVWGGFSFAAAYSMNPAAVEADSTSTIRSGRAWNLQPRFAGSNWAVEWSRWDSKADAGAAADQKGDRLNAYFTYAGFRVSPSWDKSRLFTAATGVETNNRTSWTLPFSYRTGPHTFHLEYTRAKDDDRNLIADDGAKLYSLGYVYSLSKRTTMGLVYSKLTNGAGAVYQTYSNTAGSGNPASALAAGEDGRLMSATIKFNY